MKFYFDILHENQAETKKKKEKKNQIIKSNRKDQFLTSNFFLLINLLQKVCVLANI